MAEVAIVSAAAEAGAIAADRIARLVERKPNAVLGLATGSTPLPVWAALRERGMDLSRVRGFALDPALVRVPGDDGGPVETAGERYEEAIRAAGGVDLQILGIGRTGHIGFNEPGSSLASRTRVKTLTDATRADNARFFASPEEVPRHCLTQGLGTILEARELVLLAFGDTKAEAVAGAVEGPVTASLPASVIQLHPEVTVLVDEAAASRLRYADYYRTAWQHRPSAGFDTRPA